MSNANQLVESYLAAWNERDAKRQQKFDIGAAAAMAAHRHGRLATGEQQAR